MAKGCGIFAGFVLVLLMVLCGSILSVMPRGKPLTQQEKAANEQARKEWSTARNQERLIKELVISTLKAPKTAEVELKSGWKDEELITQGFVDAQNSFGAMIRNKIHALSEGKENPQLVFLQVDDKILIDKVSDRP